MTRTSSKFRKFVLALAAVAVTAGAMAGPALADDWNHRGREEHHWRGDGHDRWRDRDDQWRDRDDYRPALYPRSYVAVVPPSPYVMVAPPAPIAAWPPPSLNLVIPLNFH
ncbi:MAG TPA: hypothetical protein VMU87_04910 [Stellaceae bacterium]|nr:hypothetical protein [Stellaceae bacterium]